MNRYRIRWMIVILIGSICTGLIGGSIFVQSHRFRSIVLKKVNSSIPGSIEIASHRISFIRGKIDLGMVRINDPKEKLVAGADRIICDLSLQSLLKRKIVISSLRLASPSVDLTIDEKRQISLISAFIDKKDESKIPEQEETSLLDLEIESFQILKGKVGFNDSANQLFIDTGNIQLNARLNLKKEIFQADMEIHDLTMEFPHYLKKISKVTLNASLNSQTLSIAKLAVSSENSSITLSGQIGTLFERPLFDLDGHVDIDLMEINPLIGPEPAMKGRTKGDIHFKGDPLNPTVGLHLTYSGGDLFSVPIEALSIKANLDDRRIQISSLYLGLFKGNAEMKGEMDFRKATPSGFMFSRMIPDEIIYNVNLTADKIEPAFIPNLSFDKNIRIRGDAVLKGKGFSPAQMNNHLELNLTEDFPPLLADEKRISSFSASIRGNMNGGILQVLPLSFNSKDHKAQIKGYLDFYRKEMDAVAHVTSSDFLNGLKPFRVNFLKGSGDIQIKSKGAIDSPVVSLSLSGQNISVKEYRMGTVKAKLKGDTSGLLEIEQLAIFHGEESIKAAGFIRGVTHILDENQKSAMNLKVSFNNLSPSRFSRGTLTGTVSGQAKIQGELLDPSISLSINGEEMGISTIRLGNISSDISLLKGCLTLRKFTVKNLQSTLHAKGDIELFSSGDIRKIKEFPIFQVTLNGTALFIEDFINGHSGKLTLFAEMGGTFDNMEGDVEIQGGPFLIFNQYVERVQMHASVEEKTVALDLFRSELRKGQTISAKGSYGFYEGHPFEISTSGKNISLEEIDAISSSSPLKGKAEFDLKGEGSVLDPSISATVDFSDLYYKNQMLSSSKVTLNFKHHKVTALMDNPVQLKGTFDLSSSDIALSAIFRETDLEPYLAFSNIPDLSGKLSGKFLLYGNTANYSAWNISAALSGLSLKYQENPLMHLSSLKATLRNRQLSIPQFKIDMPDDGYLWVKGEGDLNRNLQISVKGMIPVQTIEPFVDTISNTKGAVQLETTLSGKITSPSIRMDLTLSDIEGRIDPLSHPIKNLNGNIHLRHNALLLKNVSGMMGKGTFNIDGTSELSAFQPTDMNFKLKTNAFPVEISDLIRVVLHSDLTFRGNLTQSHLEGQLQMIEGIYDKDFKINVVEALNTQNWKKKPELPKRKENPLDFISLNVGITPINPFVVDNNFAYLDISPNLHLRGTMGTPVINGQAKVSDGRIYYKKHEFVVKRGVVDFIDPYVTKPVIDIQAAYEIRQWLIDLKISGTPENLSFNLTSIPEEEHNDIVSLILMGKTTDELIKREGGTTTSPQQMLASIVATTLGDDIKKRTGIDILEIETGDDKDPQSADRIQLTLGKQLSKRLTVKYAVETKNGETNQRAISEYQFLDHILANSYQDTSGAFGGKLFFRIEFR